MEKDLIKIFKSIKHIDKRFSVSNVGDELKELDYCITLSYSPEILTGLEIHKIESNNDFNFDMEEFGGIVRYKNEEYIRRINLNLSNEVIHYSSNKGLQFFYLSQKNETGWEMDSESFNPNNGQSFAEYFLLSDVYNKLINQLDDIFKNYNVHYNIYLTKYDLIFKIWPYDKNSIRI